jgi:adenylate kinase
MGELAADGHDQKEAMTARDTRAMEELQERRSRFCRRSDHSGLDLHASTQTVGNLLTKLPALVIE